MCNIMAQNSKEKTGKKAITDKNACQLDKMNQQCLK